MPFGFSDKNRRVALLIGRLILFGFTWSVIHHMLGGIRHLIWDTGRGLDRASAQRSAWIVAGVSVIVTVILIYWLLRSGAYAR